MMNEQTFINQLENLLKQMNLSLSNHQLKQFYAYHQLLLSFNKVMDLTAIDDENEMIYRHYIDSLSILSYKEVFMDSKNIIDVGSGAGLPGIPLAIALEDRHFLLLDSQKKRVDFLQEVVHSLNLSQVQVLHGRAEDIAHNPLYREHFDIATARAVAPLPVLLEYLLPFVRKKGYALALKGPKAIEEVANSLTAAITLGGNLLPLFPLSLPNTSSFSLEDYSPMLAIAQKEKPTPLKYPRKAGLPTKRPL